MAKPQGRGDGGRGGDNTPSPRDMGLVLGAGAAGLGIGLVIGFLAGGAAVTAGPVIAGGALIVIGGGLVIGTLGGFIGGDSSGGGSSGGGCFVGGTQVLMADMSRKPIEEVAVNDLVLSRHETTGVLAGCRVSEVFVHDVGSTLNLTLAGGQVVGTTGAHRFALGVDRFSAARSIDVGTRLCTDVSSIELLGREVVRRKARVYNFTVEEFNTYFVGPDHVWVHNLKNSDPDDPPDDDGDP